jgi:hypothetical protein
MGMKKDSLQFSIKELFQILLVPFLIYTVFVILLKSTTLQNILWLWYASTLTSEAVAFPFYSKK